MGNNEKEYLARISDSANDRMAEHFEFLARVSENAANRLLDELLGDMQDIEDSPFANPVFERWYLPTGKYRYKISCKRYRIVYQINGNEISIDDIQDCRQADGKSPLYVEE